MNAGSDRLRQTESRKMNRAEWRGDEMRMQALSDHRLSRDRPNLILRGERGRINRNILSGLRGRIGRGARPDRRHRQDDDRDGEVGCPPLCTPPGPATQGLMLTRTQRYKSLTPAMTEETSQTSGLRFQGL
jgi:hypothetical protein